MNIFTKMLDVNKVMVVVIIHYLKLTMYQYSGFLSFVQSPLWITIAHTEKRQNFKHHVLEKLTVLSTTFENEIIIQNMLKKLFRTHVQISTN